MNFSRDILPLKNIMFRTALRITLNREDAEDIVQDTMLRLWERRDTLPQIQNLEAFAVRSARNLAIDRRNLAVHKVVSLDEEEHDRQDATQADAHEQLVHEEKIRHVHQLISQLPEKQRTAIQLRDIEGKTYREIAEIMDITESDVKINIYRARKFLQNSCNFFPS